MKYRVLWYDCQLKDHVKTLNTTNWDEMRLFIIEGLKKGFHIKIRLIEED